MATCYICGKSHAEYRRNVPTGTSYRTSCSSRGRSYNSSSVRYGRRSVCAHCAFKIDYNNKRSTGFILSGIFGGTLIGIGILCGIILHYKITYNQGIGCIFFGLLISILGISLTQRKANKWKEENEGEYIDSYEIIQQEKLQKSIERENKKKQKLPDATQKRIRELEQFDKELKQDLKIVMSKEKYEGYHLSLAQAAMLSEAEIADKIKTCKIVKNCLDTHKGKNKLKQELFDNFCPVDNYLFADLVFCCSLKEEREIMEEWYRGSDEFESIRNDCYLSFYPDVLQDLKKHFEWLEKGYSKSDIVKLINKYEFIKPDNIIDLRRIIDSSISKGIYNSDIEIAPTLKQSVAALRSIMATTAIGTLSKYEVLKSLECIHYEINKLLRNSNLESVNIYDTNNKYIGIFGLKKNLNFKNDYMLIDDILKPFNLREDKYIGNPYFRDLYENLFAFQYDSTFQLNDDYINIVNDVWTENDTKILKLICSRFSHPSLVAASFFKLYLKETGRLDKIPENISIDKLIDSYANYLNKDNCLGCGVSIKKNKFSDTLFIENKKTCDFYISYDSKQIDEKSALLGLKTYSNLIGKCPSIKELDYPYFTLENEIEVKDTWYTLPRSNYFKSNYGSIRNAYKEAIKL